MGAKRGGALERAELRKRPGISAAKRGGALARTFQISREGVKQNWCRDSGNCTVNMALICTYFALILFPNLLALNSLCAAINIIPKRNTPKYR